LCFSVKKLIPEGDSPSPLFSQFTRKKSEFRFALFKAFFFTKKKTKRRKKKLEQSAALFSHFFFSSLAFVKKQKKLSLFFLCEKDQAKLGLSTIEKKKLIDVGCRKLLFINN